MTQQSSTVTPFSVVMPQSFYTVNGVRLPSGEYGSVQVTQQLLDDCGSRTQSGWEEYRRRTGWGPGSGPLITALLTGLYEHRGEGGVEELRRLFAADFFRSHQMPTSTRVTYLVAGLDVVTHDAGTPDEQTLEVLLVGPSGRVDAGMVDVLQALLGNGRAEEVRDVYKWVTGCEPRLWRLDEKLRRVSEQVFTLGGKVGDFVIGADGHLLNYAGHARGMRIVPQNLAGSGG